MIYEFSHCPFCGKDGFQEVSEHLFADHAEYRVECNNCGAQGPNEISVKQAIKMWNLRRAPEGKSDEKVFSLSHDITGVKFMGKPLIFFYKVYAWALSHGYKEE